MKNKKTKSEPTQVRHTGGWSADSKLASIKNGYWEDPYFERFNGRSGVPNRTSLICRGYYVRFRVCDYFLRNIINSINEPFQIVSLGSGMDTTYFHLIQDYAERMTGFFEVDFPTVTANKHKIIEINPELSALAKERLRLVPADLRCLDSVFQALQSAKIILNQTTIFYSECVVNYLKPNESEAILSWITSNFEKGVWLAYEQCFPEDAFGQIMVEHFRKNGCPILSISGNGCMSDQLNQLKQANFKTCHVFNAWDSFIKITKSEALPVPVISNPQQQFDEYEAFLATCLHYSIRIGISAKLSLGDSFQFLNRFTYHTFETISNTVREIRATDVFTCSNSENLRGQASVAIDDMVITLGGCDETSKIVPSVIEFRINKVNTGFSITSHRTETSEMLQRMYSSAVYVPEHGNKSVILMGGRKSPLLPSNSDLVLVSKNLTAVNSTRFNSFCVLAENGISPCARWRHGMIHCIQEDKNYIFLFGGKTADETGRSRSLGDFWKYSIAEGLWTCLTPEIVGVRPSPRHSHSMCLDSKRSSIYLLGGVSADDSTLCEDAFWQYNYATDTWTEWTQQNPVARKLGHVAVVHQHSLLIIGGYGNQEDCELNCFITAIDLESKAVLRYKLNLDASVRFLPFGFSAHVICPEGNSEDILFVFGGGGNCFSFGSHYNNSCLLIKLPLSK